MQQGISSALHETITKDTSSASSDPSKLQWEDSDNEDESKKQRGVRPNAKQILRIPGNEYCCDCGKIYWFLSDTNSYHVNNKLTCKQTVDT